MPANDTQTTPQIYTILSLCIAALAVFVSPLITWFVTKLQLGAAERAAATRAAADRKVANKQIVAPMRQAWIEKLRADIASLLTLCNRYAMRGTAEHNDDYDNISQLILVIRLTLNSAEPTHIFIIDMLEDFFFTAADDTIEFPDYGRLREKEAEIVELAKVIFKKEWERVKSEDAN